MGVGELSGYGGGWGRVAMGVVGIVWLCGMGRGSIGWVG